MGFVTARAWTASLLRDVPMGAIQIAVFELLKSAIVQSPGIDLDVSSVQAEAGLGAIGGLLTAVVVMPIGAAIGFCFGLARARPVAAALAAGESAIASWICRSCSDASIAGDERAAV